MFTIHLKDLQFRAHHGLYDEEKTLGNDFVVNAHVHYLPLTHTVQNINEVLNYEVLFSIIKKRMAQPTPLLETIVMELCYAVLDTFHQAESVFVSIEKMNPPIPGMKGSVAVSFQISRHAGGEEHIINN